MWIIIRPWITAFVKSWVLNISLGHPELLRCCCRRISFFITPTLSSPMQLLLICLDMFPASYHVWGLVSHIFLEEIKIAVLIGLIGLATQSCSVTPSQADGCSNIWMWLGADKRRFTHNAALRTWLFDLAADVWFLLKCTPTRPRRVIWILGHAV